MKERILGRGTVRCLPVDGYMLQLCEEDDGFRVLIREFIATDDVAMGITGDLVCDFTVEEGWARSLALWTLRLPSEFSMPDGRKIQLP